MIPKLQISNPSAARPRVRQILRQTTGHEFAVFPVVVFPGWWVQGRAPRRDIWVLNEKALIGFLGREEYRLSEEDVALYVARLEEHARQGAGT